MPMDVDETFVSINLDNNECELCHVDTGDALTTCTYCLGQVGNQRVREGFNKVLHIDTSAHAECFAKCHEVVKQRVESPGSPVSPPRRESVDVTDHIKDAINGKLQWLIKYAKNSHLEKDRTLDVRNECSTLQVHSTPCTRTPSPVPSPRSTPSGSPKHGSRENHALNSSKSRKCSDQGLEDLQSSYLKYLFGGNVPKEWKNNNQVSKAEKLKMSKSYGDLQRIECQRSALVPERGSQRLHINRSTSSVKRSSYDKDGEQHTVQLMRNARTECDETQRSMIALDSPVKTVDCKVNNNILEHESDDHIVPSHQSLTKQQLDEFSLETLRDIVKTLSSHVEGASSTLVTILQERDCLQHEVGVRHATIAKLVKIKQRTVQEKVLVKA